MTKICCISDLHGNLINDIDPCELVIIAGDSVALQCQSSSKKTRKWFLEVFKPWAEALDCEKVLFIAGNHELHFRGDMEWVRGVFGPNNKVTYLENEEYTYIPKEGTPIRIYGTPYCKIFGRWAFMYCDEFLEEAFNEIPEGLDILLTHDAPYGCSDILLEKMPWTTGEHIGNVPLREAILKKSPKYCIHGHLHSTNHEEELLGNTKVYNCSINSERYTPDYNPVYIYL